MGYIAFSGFGDVSAISQNTTSDAGLSTVCSDDDENDLRPSRAINSPLIDQQKVDNLASIFPRIPRDVIESAVMTCGSLNSAVKLMFFYSTMQQAMTLLLLLTTTTLQRSQVDQKLFLRCCNV